MITAVTEPISSAWVTAPLGAVREEQHVDEDDRRDEEEDDPQRNRDHALGAVDAIAARLLAGGGLREPRVVGRLLGWPTRAARPLSVLKSATPHGLIASPWVPASMRSHSGPATRAGVAEELAGQVRGGRAGQELGRLHLLDDGERLGLGARPRLVVAGERQEDDEAERAPRSRSRGRRRRPRHGHRPRSSCPRVRAGARSAWRRRRRRPPPRRRGRRGPGSPATRTRGR